MSSRSNSLNQEFDLKRIQSLDEIQENIKSKLKLNDKQNMMENIKEIKTEEENETNHEKELKEKTTKPTYNRKFLFYNHYAKATGKRRGKFFSQNTAKAALFDNSPNKSSSRDPSANVKREGSSKAYTKTKNSRRIGSIFDNLDNKNRKKLSKVQEKGLIDRLQGNFILKNLVN